MDSGLGKATLFSSPEEVRPSINQRIIGILGEEPAGLTLEQVSSSARLPINEAKNHLFHLLVCGFIAMLSDEKYCLTESGRSWRISAHDLRS